MRLLHFSFFRNVFTHQVRAIHTLFGKNILVCSARHRCLGPECKAVIDATIAAMKKRDEGGEDAVRTKKRGPDRVDKAPEEVKAALRNGDIKDHMMMVKTLLKGGVSFMISDPR